MPFLPDESEGATGRFKAWLSRIGNSRRLRDCRTYYQIALFALSIAVFLNILILILSIIKLALWDVITFSISTLFCGALAGSIYYLIKYSNMPDSDYWLTDAQSHIVASSFICFFIYSYGSSLRQPWSRTLGVCLSSRTTDFIGNTRCQLIMTIDYLVWIAPISMFIAGCVIYFKAADMTRRIGAERG